MGTRRKIKSARRRRRQQVRGARTRQVTVSTTASRQPGREEFLRKRWLPPLSPTELAAVGETLDLAEPLALALGGPELRARLRERVYADAQEDPEVFVLIPPWRSAPTLLWELGWRAHAGLLFLLLHPGYRITHTADGRFVAEFEWHEEGPDEPWIA